MPASDQHPEYRKFAPRWAVVEDCVAGSDAVKAKGKAYLPMPNEGDNSEENKRRYNQYVQRAVFVNFTSSTLEGVLGMVFRREPEIDLSATLEYLRDNATGSGVSLSQLLRSSISQTIQKGRMGFLVDYPAADSGLSQRDVAGMGLSANVVKYEAQTIINWQTKSINGTVVLAMIVLSEDFKVYADDGFSWQVKPYHRVLRLDDDGCYRQYVYNDLDAIIDIVEPRKADGSKWEFIPFAFCGSTNNDSIIDKSPLYDIANLDISHYRNSADFEESSHVVGQPTPVFAGLTEHWVSEVMKGGVHIGSRGGVMLPVGGHATLMQVNENSMPMTGMDKKEMQLVKIGARLIEDRSQGNETVDAARMRYAGQTSKLAVVVGNVEAAINQCLVWAQLFMGGEGESVIKLNREYYDRRLDAQTIMAEIALFDRGLIAKTDLRTSLRSGGHIAPERTNEEIDEEAEVTTI